MIAPGAARTVSITVERVPGSIHQDQSFTAGTTIDSRITVLLLTPATVTVNGTSSRGTSVQAGAYATSGTVSCG